MTSKLTQFKLPDSEVVVTVRGISPVMITMDIQRALKKPDPPVQVVEVGDGNTIVERNPSSPNYKIELEEWDDEVNRRSMAMLISRAVVKKLNKEEKEDVKAVRDEFKDAGLKLEMSDKSVWFKHIACGSDRDWQEFFEYISKTGEPSEKEVSSIEKSF